MSWRSSAPRTSSSVRSTADAQVRRAEENRPGDRQVPARAEALGGDGRAHRGSERKGPAFDRGDELRRRLPRPAAEHLKKKLGIDWNGTTADGRFTLKEGECFGACGDAPVMLVNNKKMLSFMTPDKLDKWIAEAK